MDIRPIKTERDYNAAIKRIEALWGAKKDTPEGDELDLLVTLVEAYELKHYPIAPYGGKSGAGRHLTSRKLKAFGKM